MGHSHIYYYYFKFLGVWLGSRRMRRRKGLGSYMIGSIMESMIMKVRVKVKGIMMIMMRALNYRVRMRKKRNLLFRNVVWGREIKAKKVVLVLGRKMLVTTQRRTM